jgi:hypothetical protein
MKKRLFLLFISFLCSALLFSQSLVEVSKKEKERREQLKGKNVKVITNADLKQMAKKPAVATPALEPAPPQPAQEEASVTPPETQETGPAQPEAYSPGFATAVLPDTVMVENPEAALYSQDGEYAEISLMGFLDLEFSAKNGPGDDIAIYARRAGTGEGVQIEEGLPANIDGAEVLGGLAYGVLVKGESGDWEAIGQGIGMSSPETFDLGSISSIKKIRIVFKYFDNANLGAKPYVLQAKEYSMGIDAVVALH